MSFVYPLLLGGLVLAGVPILIHLIMQQKPKRLPFPAFRFLLQKHRTNQRKLRLRHLLLLALRIALIALLCLALARPRLFSERLNLGSDRPAAVAMLFDTSMSMEYTVGGKNRLDEAKRRALELLDALPEGSQVAVLDSADLGGEWQQNLSRVREQINGLSLRPGNSPVTRQVAQASRLFATAAHDEEEGPPPWFLYVFTDRTLESWDEGDVRGVSLPEGLNTVLVDVGVENAADVAIVNVELPRTTLGPEDRLEARVTFQATGQDCDTFATFRVDGETEGEKRPVQLRAGESVVVSIERSLATLKPGPHRLEVKLGTNDSLPYDNARFATFEIRGGRKVLAVADDLKSARIWKLALDSGGTFRCDVERGDKAAGREVTTLLADYRAICLVNVTAPDRTLWSVLEEYVRKGGNLAIVPGPEMTLEAWNEEPVAQRLLPAKWSRVVRATAEAGAPWDETRAKHPLLAPLQTWRKTADVDFLKPEFLPRAVRYWAVEPLPDEGKVIVDYGGEPPGRAALVERSVGQGRVLLLTTGFDGKQVNDKPWWNNYLESSFYPVFVNLAVGYLAGDADVRTLNWTAGQVVTVQLPPSPRFPIYILQGPGLIGAETTVTRAEDQNELRVPQATTPGNYSLEYGAGTVAAGFSVNVRPEECQLGRVPAERIEEYIGREGVMSLDRTVNLNVAVQGHYKQPVELLPIIMLLLLVVLAVENLLANRFYRRTDVAAASPAPLPPAAGERG